MYIYNSFRQYNPAGTIDLDGDSIKVALLTSAYTPNLAHTIFGDVSAAEVAAGSGYSSGGNALAGKAVTYSGAVGKFDADDLVWAALTKTFRFGVMYVDATKDGIVKPLIGYILFDDTPADIVVAGVDFVIQWNTSGILNFT
jgi:hypothetical protein